MAKQLSAKSHNEEIMAALNRQRCTNTKYCDITLMVEDKQFNAHRSILAASSIYFDDMFQSQMSEEFKAVIEIKSVSKQAMQDVIDFIYTNHVYISIDNVEEVLLAASLMQIQDLIGLTIEYLLGEISPSNCLHFRQLGKLYSLKELVVKCNQYILENFDEISIQTKFYDIKADELGSLLSYDDISVSSEEFLYEVLIRWVKHDFDARKEHFPTLFQHLRLQLVAVDYLSKIIRKESLVRASLDCRDLVEDAFYFHVKPDMYEKEKRRFGEQHNIMFVPLDRRNVVSFNLKENLWTKLKVTGVTQPGATIVAHDGKVYCFEVPHIPQIGFSFGVQAHSNTRVQCFDGTVWHTLQPIPQCVYNCFAAFIQGKIFVFGLLAQLNNNFGQHRKKTTGITRSSEQFSICTYMYNILNNSWKCVGQNSTSIFRTSATTVVVEDTSYLLGGYLQLAGQRENRTEACVVVDLYNASNNQWTAGNDMNEARALCGAVCLNETIFAFGGLGIENTPLSSAESMNIATGVWTKLTTDVPYPLGETSACLLNKNIAVYGSLSPGRIAMFTPAKNKWQQLIKVTEQGLISGPGRLLLV